MSEAPANAVQSAALAMQALQALADCAPSASLSAIAAVANMPAPKLHRYLQAMIATGFATQDAAGGRYALGPAAISLGLAAMARLDVQGCAAEELPRLRDATGLTAFFAVWGNKGPTIVRVCEPAGAVTIVSRPGSVLPLESSATGQAFCAFLQPGALPAAGVPDAARLAAIRAQGFAAISGTVLAGIDAAAAPVFAPPALASHGLAGVFTILGPRGTLDARAGGPVMTALREAAFAASTRLGWIPKKGE